MPKSTHTRLNEKRLDHLYRLKSLIVSACSDHRLVRNAAPLVGFGLFSHENMAYRKNPFSSAEDSSMPQAGVDGWKGEVFLSPLDVVTTTSDYREERQAPSGCWPLLAFFPRRRGRRQCDKKASANDSDDLCNCTTKLSGISDTTLATKSLRKRRLRIGGRASFGRPRPRRSILSSSSSLSSSSLSSHPAYIPLL